MRRLPDVTAFSPGVSVANVLARRSQGTRHGAGVDAPGTVAGILCYGTIPATFYIVADYFDAPTPAGGDNEGAQLR